MELNQRNLNRMQAGDVLRDTQIRGLHLRRFDQSAAFYLAYRTRAGRRRCPKLGAYPALGLTEAREAARKLLTDVAGGGDPYALRTAPTVADLLDRYLTDHAASKKSRAEDARLAGKIKATRLGKSKVATVTYDDIYEFHRSKAATPYAANRYLALLSTAFNCAEKWRWRGQGSNPCRHVQRFPEKKRRRYMSSVEMKAVAAALAALEDRYPGQVLMIWLLILTGARKGEIAAARWEWLHGNTLRLPDSKTGARTIYLPDEVVAMLERVPRLNATITGVEDCREAWKKVRTMAGVPDLRVHDLRHSFASMALAAGLSLPQIGELLGHASPMTTARYAHLIEETAMDSVAKVAGRITSALREEEG